MNERMVPAISQADFSGTPRDLSIRSSDDFGGDIASLCRQKPSQQPGREINATDDFPDPRLRSPLEQRFTSYSHWPGESFGETEHQDVHDLGDPQVRVPFGERFTSYWWGGALSNRDMNFVTPTMQKLR